MIKRRYAILTLVCIFLVAITIAVFMVRYERHSTTPAYVKGPQIVSTPSTKAPTMQPSDLMPSAISPLPGRLVLVDIVCDIPRISFSGDHIGSQCSEVPLGLIFITEDKGVEMKCFSNYTNLPCWTVIENVGRVMVDRCIKEVACQTCSTSVKTTLIPDPTCAADRERY
jgi:hypothetical protein